MRLQTAIPQALVQALCNDVALALGFDSEPSLVVKKTIENPYSRVHVVDVTVNQFCTRLYVKIPHSSVHDDSVLRERLSVEYQIMQTMCESSGRSADYGVATPLGYYPEFPAFATFEAGRKTLRMYYRTRARVLTLVPFRKVLVQSVEHCGRWLCEFQDRTRKDAAPFDVKELVVYCDVRIRRLLRQNRIRFDEKLAAGIEGAIRKHATGIRAVENRIVGRHNDFASHNLLADQARIRVIDFSMFDYGSAAYDPCNFWLELEMLKLDPTYSRSFLGSLQETFLVEYGQITPEMPAFMLARCRYTLNRLVSALESPGGMGLNSTYRSRVSAASLEWLGHFASGACN